MRWRRRPPEAAAGSDSISPEVVAEADFFVASVGENAGRTLDFSERSVEDIEAIIAGMSATADALSPEDRSKIIHGAGSYLLEVGRRQFGGNHQVYAERGVPVLVVGEPEFAAAYLTYDKVAGRLAGDEADNLPFHYLGLKEAVAGKQTALIV